MTVPVAQIIPIHAPLVQGRAARHLAAVQGEAMGAVAESTDAVDRLDTRRLVDRRSDAHLAQGVRLCMAALADPANWRAYVTASIQHQLRGRELDGIEDEHCDAARTHAARCGDYGRKAVGGIQALLSPCDDDGPEAA